MIAGDADVALALAAESMFWLEIGTAVATVFCLLPKGFLGIIALICDMLAQPDNITVQKTPAIGVDNFFKF